MLICSEKIRHFPGLSRMLWPKNPDADTLTLCHIPYKIIIGISMDFSIRIMLTMSQKLTKLVPYPKACNFLF